MKKLLCLLLLLLFSANIFANIEAKSTQQDNEQRHTGYVDVSLNLTNAHEIWTKTFYDAPFWYLKQVVTDNSHAYFSTSDALYALDKSNGETIWKTDFVNNTLINAPNVDSNGVYVEVTNSDHNGVLYALSVDDGHPLFKTDFTTQWWQLGTVTLTKNAIYASCGYVNGELCAYDIHDGTLLWLKDNGMMKDGWSPSIWKDKIVVLSNNGLDIFNMLDGEHITSYREELCEFYNRFNVKDSLVVGDMDDAIFMSAPLDGACDRSGNKNRLISMNLENQSINWSIDTPKSRLYTTAAERGFVAQPVVSNGVIYTTTYEYVYAFSELTGKLLWSWTRTSSTNLGSHTYTQMILTNNTLLVANNDITSAIDLETHQTVGSLPGGLLSLNGTTLYITSHPEIDKSKIIAISLK